MGGRKSKPGAMREMAGHPGKRGIVRDLAFEEPKLEHPVAAVTMAPPKWLNPIARAEWKRLAPMLQRLRLLHAIDATAFTMYCILYSQWHAAAKILNSRGSTYKTKSRHGEIERILPAFSVLQITTQRMQRLLSEFGLTPAARASLGRAVANGQLGLGLDTPPGADRPRDPRPLRDTPVGYLVN